MSTTEQFTDDYSDFDDTRARVAELERELAALREETAWRPAETAPKDKTLVEVWGLRVAHNHYKIHAARWSEFVKDFIDEDGNLIEFTHWRPYPKGPNV